MLTITPYKPVSQIRFKSLSIPSQKISFLGVSGIADLFSGLRVESKKSDVFEKTKTFSSDDVENFNKFSLESGHVSLDEYNEIKDKSPSVLDVSKDKIRTLLRDNCIFSSPKITSEFSVLSKNFFDERYGANGYTLLSIGTSPAFITESMAELGCNALFLPASGLSKAVKCDSVKEYIERYPNLLHLINYLKHIGINDRFSNDRILILLDYSSTGRSLSLIRRFITELINPQISTDIFTLQEVLHFAAAQSQKFNRCHVDDILSDVHFERVAGLCNVPHFNVISDRINKKYPNSVFAARKNELDLFYEFDNFSRASARAYQLCVLDSLSYNN